MRFPEGFLWGAATAAHQVEGGNVNNDYWEMEHAEHYAVSPSPAATPATPTTGGARTSTSWPDAGLTTYRFSLEWSRIEPEEGEFSRAALDHYRRIVDGCRDRGLTPIVTLVHFTMPRWLMHDGGWTGPEGRRPVRPVHRVRRADLEDAAYVATINEPNLMAAQPVLGGMARARRADQRPARARPGVADALLGRCTTAPGGRLRGAGPPAGMTLIGQEYIAEDGG